MNRADWLALAVDLNGTFAGGFPPDRLDVFWKRFGKQMTVAEFNAVMDPIIDRQNMAPTPHEFKAEMDRQNGAVALPWPEVWQIAEQAAHHCGSLHANRVALDWAAAHGVDIGGMVARDITTGEPGNVPGEALAIAVVGVNAGRPAAEWFAAHGRAQILSPAARFGDETYGGVEIRKLGETYDQYVQAHPPGEARPAIAAPATRHLNR